MVRKNRSSEEDQPGPETPDKKVKKEKTQPPRRDAGKDTVAGTPAASGIFGWVSKARTFLQEVRVEFEKVTWPSRKEAVALTVAVLALTFFFTAYLGLVDIALSKLVRFLIY